MKINWIAAYRGLSKGADFHIWTALKKFFGQLDITFLELIGYHIIYNVPRYTRKYTEINRAIRGAGIKIPPQHTSLLLSPSRNTSLYEFVEVVKESCDIHSVYAYICCMLFMSLGQLNNVTVGDWPDRFANFPLWLKAILKRQYGLTQNSFLKDDDPLFFLEDGRGVKSWNIKKQFPEIESKLGITISEFIYYYRQYAGMPRIGRMAYGSNPDITIELDTRRRRSLQKCVAILELKEIGRKGFDNGFCLKEMEPGIYLVHGTKGIFVVPFYLMDMPRVTQKERANLAKLNYIDEDTINGLGFSGLTKQKVELRKI